MSLSLNKASGPVARGPAGGWPPVPFSRFENRQGLAERRCAGAPAETHGCGCVGHDDLSFPPCSIKQLRVQHGTLAGESSIRIVFNKMKTRGPLAQMDEFLSQDIDAGDLTITSRP